MTNSICSMLWYWAVFSWFVWPLLIRWSEASDDFVVDKMVITTIIFKPFSLHLFWYFSVFKWHSDKQEEINVLVKRQMKIFVRLFLFTQGDWHFLCVFEKKSVKIWLWRRVRFVFHTRFCKKKKIENVLNISKLCCTEIYTNQKIKVQHSINQLINYVLETFKSEERKWYKFESLQIKVHFNLTCSLTILKLSASSSGTLALQIDKLKFYFSISICYYQNSKAKLEDWQT